MSKIKVMSEQLSNRIAAGEVIERPASVVKELVENAIDAGARHIRIEIEKAGSRLISVADDGSGMDGDDALLCIEPHGTSKIFTEEDIDRITTLGFRGEALPSIASISRFSIQTRTSDMLEGTRVRVEGGRLLEAAPAGCPVGTVMQVRDLFFNTPARRKFLKAPATEAHHIEEMVLSMALPRHEVGFELRMDGRLVFNSPASSTAEARIREFFGRQFADAMWPVDHAENGIRVTGFVASPGFTRNSRKEQRTFINGRAVESQTLYRGIREGYATLNEPGRFPPVILYLEMPPEEVDVNVHPAKREVRFKHEYAISRAVTAAVSKALKRSREVDYLNDEAENLPLSGQVPLHLVLDSAKISYTVRDTEQQEFAIPSSVVPPEPPAVKEESTVEPEPSPSRPVPAIASPPVPRFSPSPVRELEESPEAAATESAPDAELPPGAKPLFLNDPPPETPQPREVPPEKHIYPDAPFNGDWPTEILGVLDDTYILCAGRTGLVMIDQHAAHERIMFEHLLKAARTGVPAQPLLLPQLLELPATMSSLLLRNRKVFEVLGFDIEPMGSTSVMLNALPMEMPTHRPLNELIPDMLQELLDNMANKMPVELEYVARAACHAAIKAHDRLSPEGARELLRQLGECRQGTLCPHGRPTMVTVTFKEIEKRFGRR